MPSRFSEINELTKFLRAKPQSLFAKTANKNLEAASEQQPAAEEEKNSEL
jgi:hypothetical protein